MYNHEREKKVHFTVTVFLGLCLIHLSLLLHREKLHEVCHVPGPGYTTDRTKSLDNDLAATSSASNPKKH